MTSPGRSGEGHTPGPWFADLRNERRDGGRFYVFVTAAGLVPICAVTSGVEGYGREEGRANASLIGAAPEMLAALAKIIPTNLSTTNPNISDDAFIPFDMTMGEIRSIAALVAKATGKATP